MAELLRTEKIVVDTRGNADVVDLTEEVGGLVARAGLEEGSVLVFVSGSTAALTTIEHEPGLLRDLPELLDRLVPADRRYHHDDTWHDGNGHSHLRASLIGPSLTVPVAQGRLLLGTWQQVVLVDLDNRPRHRELVVQLRGRVRG
jgi:secondary thiamine-phosphate synthase enzyme